jgi:hypothetical protein
VTSPENIDQLLALNDTTFVQGAYLALLAREADPEGLRYYTGRLRAGHAKAEIIAQIAASVELSQQGGELPGLHKITANYHKSRHWFWRIIGRGNRIEQQVYRIENELGRKTQHLVEQQAICASRLDQLEIKLMNVQASSHTQLPDATPETARAIAKSPTGMHGMDLLRLAPRARHMMMGIIRARNRVVTRGIV